jgi:hypothetical protein
LSQDRCDLYGNLEVTILVEVAPHAPKIYRWKEVGKVRIEYEASISVTLRIGNNRESLSKSVRQDTLIVYLIVSRNFLKTKCEVGRESFLYELEFANGGVDMSGSPAPLRNLEFIVLGRVIYLI